MEHYYSPADISNLIQKLQELEKRVDDLEHGKHN